MSKHIMSESWLEAVENLTNRVYIDEKKALEEARKLLKSTIKEFGAQSKETLHVQYRLGIIYMLTKDYSSAETSMLSAMELAEGLFDAEMYASIVKCLSVLYEALGRKF